MSISVKITIILQLSQLIYTNGAENNVCTNLQSYITQKYNKNCYFNPDVGGTPEQLIAGHGYPFESHSLTTEDGYILNLYRIPHDNVDKTSIRQPVLMHHGLIASSTYFFSIRNNSLPFLLSNAGYDVWLSNSRGTPHSLGHRTLSVREKKYWDYSFHEIAIYDLPVTIKHIANATRSEEKIIYIGHSMGTTVGLVYSILKKQEANEHLAGLVCLCPVAFMDHIKGTNEFVALTSAIINVLAKVFNVYVVFSPFSPLTHLMLSLAPKFPFMLLELFLDTLAYGKYDSFKNIRFDALPVQFSVTPSSSAIKIVQHFMQIINSKGKFQFYDYGKKKNLQLYNSEKPPEYDVTEIQVPVWLFYGKNDYVSDEQDANHLYNNLTVENKLITSVPMDKTSKRKFNHLDFLYGKNVEYLLYYPLIEMIKKLK